MAYESELPWLYNYAAQHPQTSNPGMGQLVSISLLQKTLQDYAYKVEESYPGATADLLRYKAEFHTFVHFWGLQTPFRGTNPQPDFRPVYQLNDRPPIHPFNSSRPSSQADSRAATPLKSQISQKSSSPAPVLPGGDLRYMLAAYTRRDKGSQQSEPKKSITKVKWGAKADEMAACFKDIYPVDGTEIAHAEPLVMACFSTEQRRGRYKVYKALPRLRRTQWQCLRQITMKGHEMAKAVSNDRRCEECQMEGWTTLCVQVKAEEGNEIVCRLL